MGVFNPESKESLEVSFESNKFSRNAEKKLVDALVQGRETFPDIIQCPNKSCGYPVGVQMFKDKIELRCQNCGWTHQVFKTVSS